MAETTKTKVLNIQTGTAQKNVKTLRQQIKELKDELGRLTEGTQEYDNAARQMGDLLQRQTEITEATKNTSKDFGATISNLTGVAAGVVGAINSINAVMVMMGADSEGAQEALKNIQLMMAVIQGMGAMDNAVKALKRMSNAFKSVGDNVTGIKSLNNAEEQLQSELVKTTAFERVETSTVDANTVAKNKNKTATNTMTASEVAATTATVGLTGGLKKLALQLKAVVLANPFLTLLAAATAVIGVLMTLRQKTDDLTDANNRNKQSVDELVASYYDLSSAKDNLDNQMAWDMDSRTQQQVDAILGKYLKFSQQTTYAGVTSKKVWEDFYKEIMRSGTAAEKKLIELANAQRNYQESTYAINRATTQEELNTAMEASNKLAERRNALYKQYLQAQNKGLRNSATAVKSLKDIINDMRTLYRQVIDEIYNVDELDNMWNGEYNRFELFIKKVNGMIKAYNLADVLSDQFKEAFENWSLFNLTQYDITMDTVFSEQSTKDLKKRLEEAESLLEKYVNGTLKATEAEEQRQREVVQNLKDEVAVRKELLKLLYDELKYTDDRLDKLNELSINQRELQNYVQSIKLYTEDILQNNAYAEINKSIRDLDNELSIVGNRLGDLRQKKEKLESVPLNKQKYEDLLDVNEQIYEFEQKQTQLQIEREEMRHTERMMDLEIEYARNKQLAAEQADDLQSFLINWGGITSDYNTQSKLLGFDLEAINNQITTVEGYYDQLMHNLEKNSEEWKNLEMEKNGVLEQLAIEREQKELEIIREGNKKKLDAAKTYINLYQSLSSQVSSLLSTEMEQYDENSSKYKKLKYAQGITDTLSGTLSAFMSGIESGVPAPWNLGVALAMAGITFATGLAQLKNIKNGTLSNSATASPVNIGDYDTLSYQQNSDILSAIQDQKVYVLESEISSTQNRVRVMENQSIF